MPLPYGATVAAPYPSYAPPPMPGGYNGLYNYGTMPYPAQGSSYALLTYFSLVLNIYLLKFFILGGYNPYQPTPQAPYGGYATLPRYGGSNPQQKPW